jgi:uncharacterized membrane protein YphA (DoxX/SURF4 family)
MDAQANANAAEGPKPKSLSRYFVAAARILMGLVFVVFGLNGFLHFIPQPKTAMSPGAAALMDAFIKSGYMFPLIMGTQLLVGVLLLLNRFVPLALALLAPVVVNIVAFHAFLSPSGLVLALVVLVLELYVAWSYRKAYFPMLAARTSPN